MQNISHERQPYCPMPGNSDACAHGPAMYLSDILKMFAVLRRMNPSGAMSSATSSLSAASNA